jgi:hypothetical protein
MVTVVHSPRSLPASEVLTASQNDQNSPLRNTATVVTGAPKWTVTWW